MIATDDVSILIPTQPLPLPSDCDSHCALSNAYAVFLLQFSQLAVACREQTTLLHASLGALSGRLAITADTPPGTVRVYTAHNESDHGGTHHANYTHTAHVDGSHTFARHARGVLYADGTRDALRRDGHGGFMPEPDSDSDGAGSDDGDDSDLPPPDASRWHTAELHVAAQGSPPHSIHHQEGFAVHSAPGTEPTFAARANTSLVLLSEGVLSDSEASRLAPVESAAAGAAWADAAFAPLTLSRTWLASQYGRHSLDHPLQQQQEQDQQQGGYGSTSTSSTPLDPKLLACAGRDSECRRRLAQWAMTLSAADSTAALHSACRLVAPTPQPLWTPATLNGTDCARLMHTLAGGSAAARDALLPLLPDTTTATTAEHVLEPAQEALALSALAGLGAAMAAQRTHATPALVAYLETQAGLLVSLPHDVALHAPDSVRALRHRALLLLTIAAHHLPADAPEAARFVQHAHAVLHQRHSPAMLAERRVRRTELERAVLGSTGNDEDGLVRNASRVAEAQALLSPLHAAQGEAMVALHALGNAGHPTSLPLLRAHAAGDAPHETRLVALHSMRYYTCKESATVLADVAAAHGEWDRLHSVAVQLLESHPHGRTALSDLSGVLGTPNANFTSGVVRTARALSRQRRGGVQDFLNSLDFRLGHDPIDWGKSFGNDKLGANVGFYARNEITLEVDDFAGSFEITVDDRAWIEANLKFINKDFDIFRAEAWCVVFMRKGRGCMLESFACCARVPVHSLNRARHCIPTGWGFVLFAWVCSRHGRLT